MRLFIAEKPSLARAIADVLPAPQQRCAGYIECGGGNVVTWCAGHILELAEPDQYRLEYKTWSVDHLPIAPEKWKLAVTAPDLLNTIKSLLPRASEVVHAGDPDREGQLLVDEVLEYLGYRGPVLRILVNDLNAPAVRKALGQLQLNAKFRGLYDSARARQRADWLYGINLTRLYTLLGRAGGYDGVLSVGRVQTPLLGLIVRRDLEIERFKPTPFFVLNARAVSSGGSFTATWKPRDGAQAFLDEERRLISKIHAESIAARCSGQRGIVLKCLREKKAELAPLPYSLADLQVDAGKRLGFTPKDTLDTCQALYETHRLVTYPRSDCSYLPEGQFSDVPSVIGAIAKNSTALAPSAAAAQPNLKSRAWASAKVSAHHAIIPTSVVRANAALTPPQRQIYDLIARRYLVQFYPPFEFNQTQITIDVGGEHFTATGRQPVAQGWHLVLSAPDEERDDADTAEGSEASNLGLPVLQEGDEVRVERIAVAEKKTTPSKRFTDASLVQAMTGIARFVSDPKIKELLREADGIGTPATQAAIIQTLHDRKYIEKKGRHIVSTSIGRALIQILPPVATTPDMTALWEAAMKKIAGGNMPLGAFLDGVLKQLAQLVAHGKTSGALRVSGVAPPRPCPQAGCGGFLRQRSGKNGFFLSCSRYPDCIVTIDDVRDVPRPAQRRRHRPPRTSTGRLQSQ